MLRARLTRPAALVVFLVAPALQAQQGDSSPREAMGEAWWTGPLMTPSAATVAPGHVLIEPYLYDVIAPGRHGVGSQSYVIYGLLNRLSVGLIPVVGYNIVRGGPNSTRAGVGDFTALAQYRVSSFQPGRAWPTVSIVLEETFPTGRYDRLGDRSSDGMGRGAFTTSLGLYAQTLLWMPNGRILRLRLDLTRTFPGHATVQDESVYGTPSGFRGSAAPGAAFTASAGSEYSLTRRWVLALDLAYTHEGGTRVGGYISTTSGRVPMEAYTGAANPFAIAPAVEYNLSSAVGLIAGVRVIPSSHNVSRTLTPAVAVNIVR